MKRLSAGFNMVIGVKGKEVATDQDGFLVDLSLWNQDIATTLAYTENITLTNRHWELLYLARTFYQQYQHSPEMRPLVKFVQKELDKTKGTSIYLLSLFPGSPAKLISKIAGLPRPANCL